MVRRSSFTDFGVVSLLVLAAAAVRWPNLWLIPAFSDETLQAHLAIAIYRGQAAPLTNFDPYVGAFWNYLVAVGFWLFGLNPWLPRLVSFLAGVATVGATWWLGRELGGRVGGAIAAAFMAANSTHILVNSHVGSSHAIMPLFTTLGFACLVRALRVPVTTSRLVVPDSRTTQESPEASEVLERTPSDDGHSAASPHPNPLPEGEGIDPLSLWKRVRVRATDHPNTLGNGGRWLGAAGALLGMGVQTHGTAALLLPGAALAVVLARPGLILTRWTVLAMAAFLLVTSNLIVYNVVTGGQSLTGSLARAAEYTGDESGYDTEDYAGNLGRLVLASAWILSGAIEKRRFVGESLASPAPLLYLELAVGSVLWAARRGRWLPALVMAPFVLIMPLVNPKYEPLLNGRYLVPLLPLVFACIGLAAADGWRGLRTRRARPSWLAVAGAIGLTLLAAYPLVPLARYEASTDRTNHGVLAAYQAVAADRQNGETVLLDTDLDDIRYMAAGSAYKGLELLLSANDVPYVTLNVRINTLADELTERSPRLALLHGDKVTPLRRAFAVTPLGEPLRGQGFGAYRVSHRR